MQTNHQPYEKGGGVYAWLLATGRFFRRPFIVALGYVSLLFICATLYHRIVSMNPILSQNSVTANKVMTPRDAEISTNDLERTNPKSVRKSATTTRRPELQFRVHVGFEPRDFSCRDLFYQSGYVFNYSDFYFDHVDSYRSAVESAGIAIESSANEQSWILHEIAKVPAVENICETGFKAGHNTFMWLTASPDVTVYSFEKENRYNFTKSLAEFMAGEFPERFQLFLGDPAKTTDRMASSFNNDSNLQHFDCDIMYVDSTLDSSTIEDVMENFLRMSRLQNILIMDTHPLGDETSESRRALRIWEHFRREKKIVESFRCHYDTDKEGREINARKFQTNGLLVGSFLKQSDEDD